jgi:hypothetical protein
LDARLCEKSGAVTLTLIRDSHHTESFAGARPEATSACHLHRRLRLMEEILIVFAQTLSVSGASECPTLLLTCSGRYTLPIKQILVESRSRRIERPANTAARGPALDLEGMCKGCQ